MHISSHLFSSSSNVSVHKEIEREDVCNREKIRKEKEKEEVKRSGDRRLVSQRLIQMSFLSSFQRLCLLLIFLFIEETGRKR